MPKLFDDVESSSDIIRRIFKELGGNVPISILAKVVLDRGVLPPETLSACTLRAVAELCRDALKEKMAGDLPFAKPTSGGRDPDWKQLDLFTKDELFALIERDCDRILNDYEEVRRIHQYCLDKFGEAPAMLVVQQPQMA